MTMIHSIVSVLAFLVCSDAIQLENTALLMGRGPKKRSTSYKPISNGLRNFSLSKKKMSSLETSDGLSAKEKQMTKVSSNTTQEALTYMVANMILESDMKAAEKESLLTLLTMGKKNGVGVDQSWATMSIFGGPPSKGDISSNALPAALPPIGYGGPLSHYLDGFSKAQLDSMQAAGILDKYYRWNANLMMPWQKAFYNFIIGSEAYSDEFARVKGEVVSAFCCFYAIKTCPFTPGETSIEEALPYLYSDNLVVDGQGGTYQQSKDFTRMLLYTFKFWKGTMRPSQYLAAMNPFALGAGEADHATPNAMGTGYTYNPLDAALRKAGIDGKQDPAKIPFPDEVPGNPYTIWGSVPGAVQYENSGYNQGR